jgi:hypothetical protein
MPAHIVDQGIGKLAVRNGEDRDLESTSLCRPHTYLFYCAFVTVTVHAGAPRDLVIRQQTQRAKQD